jgi:germination protein YpeB
MSRKFKFIGATYLVAAMVVLSVLCAIEYSRLKDYRRAAAYSSRAAFEMTVTAVDKMGAALEKSLYATDGGMCGSMCGEIYARASAAEAAMASLPFETQELEKLSAFLNQAGDYAYTLSANVAETGFDGEQLQQLASFSSQADDFAAMLRQLQMDLNNGLLVLDSREEQLQNVGIETEEKLSGAMLEYEGTLGEATAEYDGQYGYRETEEVSGGYDEAQERALVARVLGVEERELKEEYSYSGTEGRRCYSHGEYKVFVSSRGIESLGQSRLVGQGEMAVEDARKAAVKFLERLGMEDLALVSYSDSGTVAGFNFAGTKDGAVMLDSTVSVSVALDDGSIYAFNGESYNYGGGQELEWNVSQEEAQESLAESLECQSSRRVIINSAGALELPCYEFSCVTEDGKSVRVYVNGETGKQCRIEI